MRHSAEKAISWVEKGKREKISLAFLLLISFSLLIFFHSAYPEMQTVYPRPCTVLKKYEAKYPHKKKNFSLEFCDRFALEKKKTKQKQQQKHVFIANNLVCWRDICDVNPKTCGFFLQNQKTSRVSLLFWKQKYSFIFFNKEYPRIIHNVFRFQNKVNRTQPKKEKCKQKI